MKDAAGFNALAWRRKRGLLTWADKAVERGTDGKVLRRDCRDCWAWDKASEHIGAARRLICGGR